MVFKKALATAAVTATAAALLISNAGANDKAATVAQGDLVGRARLASTTPARTVPMSPISALSLIPLPACTGRTTPRLTAWVLSTLPVSTRPAPS